MSMYLLKLHIAFLAASLDCHAAAAFLRGNSGAQRAAINPPRHFSARREGRNRAAKMKLSALKAATTWLKCRVIVCAPQGENA